MSIDNVAGIQISDLVDQTARRLGLSRAEAKAVILTAATAVCAPPSPPAPRPPRFQVLIAYPATA